MIAYKLFRVKKNGAITPLFINKNKELPLNEWMDAEDHPTKGFAHRMGWHCCFEPVAPHLKTELKNGEIRKWFKVEVEDTKTYKRPESQGGSWVLANRLRIIEEL